MLGTVRYRKVPVSVGVRSVYGGVGTQVGGLPDLPPLAGVAEGPLFRTVVGDALARADNRGTMPTGDRQMTY